MSAAEDSLAMQLTAMEIEHVREYRFAQPRRWRADFYIPAAELLVEVEGGSFVGGRHTRGKGFEQDAIKYNRAQLMGFMLLRYTPRMVNSGEALLGIEEALSVRASEAHRSEAECG